MDTRLALSGDKLRARCVLRTPPALPGRIFLIPLAILALAFVCPVHARAHDSDSIASSPSLPTVPSVVAALINEPHIRTEDRRLREMIERAAEMSPTFRDLRLRLEASDVVAYVHCEMQLGSGLSGMLTFVGAGGGVRYVMIRVTCTGSASAQTAVIGHELQHAIEVAGAAAVVDLPSFDREFARIGFVTSHGDNRGSRSYETRAARDAGERILRELRDRT